MPAPLSGGCGSGGGSCANLGGSGRGHCVAKDRGRVRPCVRRASGAAGAASPLGAASSRKLPSFSFLPGFFYLKGAEVPRGLCGDRNWEFTSVSEPFLLSPLATSPLPLHPASPGLLLFTCSSSLLGCLPGFALFGVWSLLGGVASPSCSCAQHCVGCHACYGTRHGGRTACGVKHPALLWSEGRAARPGAHVWHGLCLQSVHF